MSGYVVTYDGASSATAVPELVVQRISRPFVGEVRDQYVEVPGRESAWLFTEQPGDATINMECVLIGQSRAERRASVRALASWTRATDRRPLIVDDEPHLMWWAKLASRPDVDEAVRLGRLGLSWRVLPYAESVDVSSQSASGSSMVFDVPGDPDVPMYQVIEVTTAAPAASGIELEVNGTVIGVRDSLGAGVTRTFSALTATITTGANADAELAANAFDTGALAMQTAYGDFGLLDAGSNTITVTRGGPLASIRVVWRRRYS